MVIRLALWAARRALPRRWTRRSLVPIAFGLLLAAALAAHPAEASPSLAGGNANFDRACTRQGGAYTDRTTALADTTQNDVPLGDNALGGGADEVYFGSKGVFKEIRLDIDTNGVAGTVSWSYWDGSTWSSLTVVDSTVSFTLPGVLGVTFTPPAAWATTTLDAGTCPGAHYYVRAVTATAYATYPKATQGSAVEYNLKVKVQTEIGNLLTALLQSDFTVSAGSDNTVFAFRDLGSGVYEFALDTGGADTNFDVSVKRTGYVTTTQATGALTSTPADKTATPISMPYAVRVTVDDEMGENHLVAGGTVLTGDGFTTSCVEPSVPDGNYYCNVPLIESGTDVRMSKSGFVTKTITAAYADRTAHTDPQRLVTGTNLQYGNKVTGVSSETVAALTGGAVTAGDASATACDEEGSTGVYYCPVPILDTSPSFSFAKAGYVTTTGTFGVDRAANTDPQIPGLLVGVPYTVKVTVTREQGSAFTDLTGVSFRTNVNGAGFAAATPTAAGGAVAYFAQDPAAGTFVVEAAKTGYVTTTTGAAFTASAAAQNAKTTTLPFTLKVTVTGVTDLTGVTWERQVGAGSFTSVTTDATSGTNGFFALDPAAGSVTYKGIRGSITATTDAFTGSAAAQTTKTISLSDTTAPSGPTGLASSGHPLNAWKTSRTFAVTWTAATDDVGVTGYSWALDATPDSTEDGTATTATFSNVADGSHTFYVKAKDTSGNWGSTVSYGPFKVDATAPTAPTVTSSTHASNVCVAASAAAFAWTAATDAASGLDTAQPYGYALDGATVTRTTLLAHSVTVTTSGTHTFAVTAHDAASNAATTTYTFKVDTTPPTVTLALPAATNVAPYKLTWAGSDACSTITSYDLEARFGTGSWEPVLAVTTATSHEYAFPHGDGPYSFRLRAKDALNQLGTFPETPQATTLLDRKPPGVPTLLKATPADNGTVLLRWQATTDSADGSGLAGYLVYQGPDAQHVTTLLTKSPTAELDFAHAGNTPGALVFYTVRAVDKAGNEGPAVPALGLLVPPGADSRSPQVILASPQALGNASQITGHAWERAFYAFDGDGDGLLDKFTDPEGAVRMLRGGLLASDQPFYLLGREGDGSFLWMPTQQTIAPVARLAAALGDASSKTDVGERVRLVTVEGKSGWIYVALDDPLAGGELLRVEASDGRSLPAALVWREEGRIYFLDDPTTTYRLVYAPGKATLDWRPWGIGGATVLVLNLLVGLVLYRRTRRADDRQSWEVGWEADPRLAGWNGPHCPRCGAPEESLGGWILPCPMCPTLTTLGAKLLGRHRVDLIEATQVPANPATEAPK